MPLHYQPSRVVLFALLLTTGVTAQSVSPVAFGEENTKPARVRSVRVVPGTDGPAIEIMSTQPLTPKILTLREPSRLVIDLPNCSVWFHKNIDFRSEQIGGIRVSQFRSDPPTARIVVDLNKPIGYNWDAAGHRLMIRLRPLEQRIAPAPAESSSLARGSVATLVPVAPSKGVVTTRGASSSLTAGGDTAVLRLPHGGEVRVCPGTTVSVTYSPNGRDMMLGMNTGAIEADYALDASADSVMTPDFRILFAGPGEFHYAISADSRGNTCVRSLPGNGASAIVSELMGDGVYHVKSSDQVLFQRGHVNASSPDVPADCGCPAPSVPVLRTAAPAHVTPAVQVAMNGPETTPLPASQPSQVHIQVDAPFVFRATDPVLRPAPLLEVASLSVVYSPPPQMPDVMVLPPPPQLADAKPKQKGFFGKVGRFFAALFR